MYPRTLFRFTAIFPSFLFLCAFVKLCKTIRNIIDATSFFQLQNVFFPRTTKKQTMQPNEETSSSLQQANDEVTAFIQANSHEDSVTQEEHVVNAVREFVKRTISSPSCSSSSQQQQQQAPRFALITSGGTVAPLEKRHQVRHITNFSTGRRGAASAEQFLRAGYHVIFFHKTGSLLPFARHFQDGSFLNAVTPMNQESEENSSSFYFQTSQEKIARACREHHEYKNNVLFLPYHTVWDYQLGMRSILETLRTVFEEDEQKEKHSDQETKTTQVHHLPSMKHVLCYLVGAVSDYYFADAPEHKMDSGPNEEWTLKLQRVPKAVARGLVGNLWGQGAFTATFKLETNEHRISDKVLKHINSAGNIHLVCANLLQTCRRHVAVYDVRDTANPTHVNVPTDADEVEEPLVRVVMVKHDQFVAGEW